MFEVADTADSQCYKELKASVDGSRGAAHWDGLLCGELPTLHVLEVNIRCREDKVIYQLLMREKYSTDKIMRREYAEVIRLSNCFKCGLPIVP